MTQEKPTTRVNLGFDQEQLDSLINACIQDPTAAKTVWKANTRWLKGFKSEAQIRDFTITMDEPPPLGGSNTAPNMVEMVLGAYGSCLTTGYVMNAAARGIKLESVEIEVEGDLDLRGFSGLSQEVSPGYSNIRTKVHLKAPGATAEQLKALHDQTVNTSPVGAIISRPLKIETELV